MATQENHIIDNGDLKKYRTEIPNLLDKLNLSLFAFRLYFHLKCVAGANGGTLNHGTALMARDCGMSAGKTSAAKQELVQAGLIDIVAGDYKKGKPDLITLIDIWPRNFAYFGVKTSSPREKVSSSPREGVTKKPLHHVKNTSSPREGTRARLIPDPEKEPREERNQEKEVPQLQKTQPAFEETCTALQIRPPDPEWDSFAALCKITDIKIYGQARFAKELQPLRGNTPEQLTKFIRWWFCVDFRGKLGQPPTMAQIRQHWGEAMSTPDTILAEKENRPGSGFNKPDRFVSKAEVSTQNALRAFARTRQLDAENPNGSRKFK